MLVVFIEKTSLVQSYTSNTTSRYFRCDIQLTKRFKDLVFRRVIVFVELGLLRFQFRAEYRLFLVPTSLFEQGRVGLWIVRGTHFDSISSVFSSSASSEANAIFEVWWMFIRSSNSGIQRNLKYNEDAVAPVTSYSMKN